MRILVTGASGHLGRAVVAELRDRGHELLLLVPPGTRAGGFPPACRLLEGDVGDRDDVGHALRGVEVAVHLAAGRPGEGPGRLHAVDVGGLASLVQAASFGCVERIVVRSTLFADGPEAAPPPRSPHLVTRREALRLARDLASQGAPIVVLFPGVLFGPGPGSERAPMHVLGRRLLRGRLAALPGSPGVRWCHAFVTDAARGVARAATAAEPGSEYVLGGHDREPREWLAELARLAGRPAPGRPATGPGAWLGSLAGRLGLPGTALPPALGGWRDLFHQDTARGSERAVAELGYRVTPFEEAMRRTLPALGEDPP